MYNKYLKKMATGKALVCKLGEGIPINGADRIVQVNMFGETIITQKTNKEGTIGLLFDTETCLSHEFASKNNMYRHNHLNKDKSITGYLEDDRRIRPVRLKNVKCSALFIPINSLNNLGINYTLDNKIGQEIDEIESVKICEKYISRSTRKAMSQNKGNSPIQDVVPTFREHIDTEQWFRNKDKVQEGNLAIITEKLHGTSGRCGYLLVEKKNPWWKNLLLTWIRAKKITHSLEFEFVVGSRRVIQSIGENETDNKQNFYKEDLWTKTAKENFKNKLKKGETIYFEIVGYTPSGELIMPSISNKKLERFLSKEEYEEFITKYGDVTTFNYGCKKFSNSCLQGVCNSLYKVFVYRISMTNEDGDSIDLSWEQVKKRSKQLNVNYVPELAKFIISDSDYEQVSVGMLDEYINILTNDNSNLFSQHIREGVCIRIENGNSIPLFLKNKSFIFKVLEGIIKDSDKIDIEESN